MHDTHHAFQELIDSASPKTPVTTAVCHPCSEVSLLGAAEAAQEHLIEPIFVGPPGKVRATADLVHVDIAPYRLVATEHSHESANCSSIGSLATAARGLDALVFTGGIGENAAPVHAAVVRDAARLGIQLDEAANDRGGPKISARGSSVSAWVLATDEELMIARHTAALVRARRSEDVVRKETQ